MLHSSLMINGVPAYDTYHRRRIRLDPAIYRGRGLVFLVTVCTNDRHPWFSRHPALADDAAAGIEDIAAARGTILHAWCVMPDHVHLLIDDVDVTAFVRVFKGKLTSSARWTDPARRLWQRSFHDHALRSGECVEKTVRYILSNPVRAGIVAVASQYRWSGSGSWPEWRDWG